MTKIHESFLSFFFFGSISFLFKSYYEMKWWYGHITGNTSSERYYKGKKFLKFYFKYV